MRGARWLLLLAICAILGWHGFNYKTQKRTLAQQTAPKPGLLPAGLTGSYQDFHRRKTDENGRMVWEIWAQNFKQEKDSSHIELQGVRLHLYHKDGKQFDRVESPLATFEPDGDKLYADGEV